MASPRFQRLAARFPPTRPIARRRAQALFDLCAGFVYSQILAACVQLDLFALLAERPLDSASVGRRVGLAEDRARLLLDAAVALRLVSRRRGDRYGLGPLGAALLGNPGLAGMIRHHGVLYADLADPVALLRGERAGALAGYWPYAGAEAPTLLPVEAVGDYTELMAATQPMVAAEALAAYDVSKHRCLLDVGGGDGSFLRAAAVGAPSLRLMLLDLPAVAAVAERHFASARLSARVSVIGGDFRGMPFPEGADLISFVRVLHDHDDETVRGLLARARAALPAGGRVLIVEPMAGTRGAERVGDAYFGLYLVAMGSGRPRTAAVLRSMLAEAGFSRMAVLPTPTPLVASVVTGVVSGVNEL